ncbi:hypothetical protein [Bartonella mastomydis]|uniref:hypothetical protein n=1 Tax=Bartonella mastomydis TaxID=1820002 RepID=UPI001FEA8127|nr:hypothetical protein [Bartonella mastomydis]
MLAFAAILCCWILPALPVTVRVIVLKKTISSTEDIDISEVAIIIAREPAAKLAADDLYAIKYLTSAAFLFMQKRLLMYLVDVILHLFKQGNKRYLRSVVF